MLGGCLCATTEGRHNTELPPELLSNFSFLLAGGLVRSDSHLSMPEFRRVTWALLPLMQCKYQTYKNQLQF